MSPTIQKNVDRINPLPHQILSGTTWHARHTPAQHSFSYPYRYWGLSMQRLAEADFPPESEFGINKLAKLPKVPKLFSLQKSKKHKAVHSFDFADYFDIDKLDDSNTDNAKYKHSKSTHNTSKTKTSEAKTAESQQITSAKQWLASIKLEFQRLTGNQPTGDILALVVSRNLGFYFSPVNFYLGFDELGNVSHLLAEVSNTPWDKRHFYGFQLTQATKINTNQTHEFSHDKDFHVSPFNPLDQVYTWKVKVNDLDQTTLTTAGLKHIKLSIHVSDSRGKVFEAGINMQPQAMTAENLRQSIYQNPVMNYSSMGRIYWHALVLYAMKRVPYIGYNQKLSNSKQKPLPSSQSDNNTSKVKTKDKTKAKDTTKTKDTTVHTTTEPKTTAQSRGQTMSTPASRSKKPKHPTNRQPKYQSEKHTQSLMQRVINSKAFTPVKTGVDMTARRLIFKALSYLQFGSITLIETFAKRPKTYTFGDKPKNNLARQKGEMAGNHPLHLTLQVHHKDFYRQLITGGDIALADSYINGGWEVDDLTALIRLAARNQKISQQIQGKFSALTKAIELNKHKSRTNTVTNSKSNILAHYDLGNEMYQTFLDSTMMYSAAIYPTPDTPLYDAQQIKLKTLCDMLELTTDDHVLEIGTGWGGFAIYAVQNYGCKVTTTTISDAQYDEAKQRVEKAGLTDKITLLKQDYRKLTGQYDKLISIEMVEAVGHEHLPTFFEKCNSLLKPNGIMTMQAITFNDQGYEDYLNSVDFIQSHIFPGGCLLSNQTITNQFAQHTDMVVKSLIDYGYDYAYTLRDWRHAFMSRLEDIRAMGYDEQFIRLWHFYFCYCEGGFLERTIGVVQVKAVKPDNR